MRGSRNSPDTASNDSPSTEFDSVIHLSARRGAGAPFWSNRDGAAATSVALAAPLAALAIAGAIEASLWSATKSQLQSAADSAALSAVHAVRAGRGPAGAIDEALAIAAANGLRNGRDGVGVTVNNPPRTGPFAEDAKAYEVLIWSRRPLRLAGLLGLAPTAIGRASALADSASPCGVTLDAPALDMSRRARGEQTFSACRHPAGGRSR